MGPANNYRPRRHLRELLDSLGGVTGSFCFLFPPCDEWECPVETLNVSPAPLLGADWFVGWSCFRTVMCISFFICAGAIVLPPFLYPPDWRRVRMTRVAVVPPLLSREELQSAPFDASQSGLGPQVNSAHTLPIRPSRFPLLSQSGIVP